MRIELYQDASLQWRWRGVDGNFRIICDGSEGYVSREAAVRAIDNVMGEFRGQVTVVSRNRRRYGNPDILRPRDPDHSGPLDRRSKTGRSPGYDEFDELAEYQHEGTKK